MLGWLGKDVPMPDALPNMTGPEPHEVPWYTRLMMLFGRGSTPTSGTSDNEGEDGGPDRITSLAQWWQDKFTLPTDFKSRYDVYDEMDSFDMVSSILEVMAEETRPSRTTISSWRCGWRAVITIWCGRVRRVYRIRRWRIKTLLPIVRRMCKYGDDFRRLLYQQGKGVLGWKYADPKNVMCMEDRTDRLVGFKESGMKYRGERKSEVSWAWDYIHFRLLGADEIGGRGTSICAPMFRPWRVATLSEDATLMYRLRRAPDRNLIMVDVGTEMEDHEAMEYANNWRKKFKKTEYVDPACVLLSQVVRTLRGDRTVQQVITDFMAGVETWVYGYDEASRRIMPGKVTWAGVTRKQTEVVEVALDDGSVLTCTPDHLVAVMDGTPGTGKDRSRHRWRRVSGGSYSGVVRCCPICSWFRCVRVVI